MTYRCSTVVAAAAAVQVAANGVQTHRAAGSAASHGNTATKATARKRMAGIDDTGANVADRCNTVKRFSETRGGIDVTIKGQEILMRMVVRIHVPANAPT